MREYKLWLAKIITIVLLTFIIIPIVAGLSSVAKKLGPAVAVIELTGVIEDSSEVLKELYHAARDKDVKAVVLRIDSPGGAVAPS